MESASLKIAQEAQQWKGKKALALLLAIVGGPWTWLYTYRKNAWKAAIGIPIFIGFWGLLLSILRGTPFPIGYPAQLADFVHWMTRIMLGFYFLLAYLPIWIWAIVDICKIKDWSFTTAEMRDKTTAILLAVFLSPWNWFYTYRTDRWKFWPVIIINYGYTVFNYLFFRETPDMNFGNSMVFSILFSVFILGIRICAIVEAAVRPAAWYQQYDMVNDLKANPTVASNEG